ncbi:unnamed protein product [Rotaria socialis]|uniref:Uncharacterized protein n=1 Tax=Rotaria socialis TaxID=392032 RepID=A0A818F3N4_9BILA|nr:unnamed protein product [Rotaria socialis]CAF3369286.1 unnamed protein product [Rotaria socialis]CAF3458122.1 unnamed protein product [Rotaria socialis]CAF3468760.1 unnamed protein product [Rotaria socialis]CAF4207404.1 unnamed protein product [Rotaria socialis]
MPNNLIFFVPYHTGYAHVELIHSFASFADVHLFVYKWNPAQQIVRDYFSRSTNVKVHEFGIDTILAELVKQQQQQHRVVVLLTASMNYSLGQLQFRFFCAIQKNAPSIIDVYSTGHCMYGCQSCSHAHSHRLPITFTNYMRTKCLSSINVDRSADIIICPSFSSESAPYSLLSNKEIVEKIVAFTFPHAIKLHPLTFQNRNEDNPMLSLSKLEQEHIDRFHTSKSILPNSQTNTLKLIERARVLICDSDSSIPFEALYFNDHKHILVYEVAEKHNVKDDRQKYFHTFHNVQQLTNLLERYFAGELECKTENSHQFFLEKYEEPDGKEIERLADVRQWLMRQLDLDQNFDAEKVKQGVKDQFQSSLTQMTLYALGEHTTAQIHELCYGDTDDVFHTLLENIAEL